MSWRIVDIESRCKLDLSLGYMVVRGEETKKIIIDEIAILVIENPAVSFTGSLLLALTEKKVRIIFCDNKRNPYSELEPYNMGFDCSKKVKIQMAWTAVAKGNVWQRIVHEKINNQARLLEKTGHFGEAKLLQKYMTEIQFADSTNREGHAAKVYFNTLYGKNFIRNHEDSINSALNYGYSIILSTVNREVAINGYLSKIGIFHSNMFNPYNLSCDLMEPFRIIVDRKVSMLSPIEFTSAEKHYILSMLNEDFIISNSTQTLLNAIKIYVKSVFDAIEENNPDMIKFAEI